MPSRGTTQRAIRIPDALWDKAKAATIERGDTISDVVRRSLEEYVTQPPPDPEPRN